mmetsp:Transcript_7518/g.13322  ORF Transcript_7518/g.13322 Transcript_7518/m.13322 type:complete len:171 (-) Transcript_7518:34-546(-)
MLAFCVSVSNSAVFRRASQTINGSHAAASRRPYLVMKKNDKHSSKPSASKPNRSDEEKQRDKTVEDMLASDVARIKAAKIKREAVTPDAKSDDNQSLALKAKNVVQTLLVADFFIVLFFLAWLSVAVVKNDDALYDSWYKLWEPVIQPILGILMLGAIVSGILGSVGKKK